MSNGGGEVVRFFSPHAADTSLMFVVVFREHRKRPVRDES